CNISWQVYADYLEEQGNLVLSTAYRYGFYSIGRVDPEPMLLPLLHDEDCGTCSGIGDGSGNGDGYGYGTGSLEDFAIGSNVTCCYGAGYGDGTGGGHGLGNGCGIGDSSGW